MARKIKLPLDMGNDIKVRDIDELKENYNSEKVVESFLNGELLPWLQDRFYEEEAGKVKALSANKDSVNIAGRLAEIFGVQIESEVNVDEIAERNKRLAKLRSITSDDEVLRNVDLVAFSQEDMDIVHESDVIYLCGDKFRIPYNVEGKHYIGVNNPLVEISANEEIDFESKNIVVEKCSFTETTMSKMKRTNSEKEIEEVQDAEKEIGKVFSHKYPAEQYPDFANFMGLKTVGFGGFDKEDVEKYICSIIHRINVLLGYEEGDYKTLYQTPTYEGIGYLKTVSFGGYDKKDTLVHIDRLQTKLLMLEDELL